MGVGVGGVGVGVGSGLHTTTNSTAVPSSYSPLDPTHSTCPSGMCSCPTHNTSNCEDTLGLSVSSVWSLDGRFQRRPLCHCASDW